MRRVILIGILVLVVALAIARYFYVHRQESSETITLYGNVDVRQVDIGFRVSGRVVGMPYDEGELIAPGTLIAELDNQPYEDQVREAIGSLESIRTNLANAQKILDRRQELISGNDGSISMEDYENTLATRDSLAANLKQAEAALGVANTNLSDTKAYAPAEGIILTRIREPGTVVKVGDPVYTLSLTSPVWIRAYIPEPLLGVVYPNMEAEVFTDSKDGKPYKGHIGFISPVSEFTPKTVETTQLRTDLVYRLRIIADNPDHGLRQGMPVTVKLHPKKNESKSSDE